MLHPYWRADGRNAEAARVSGNFHIVFTALDNDLAGKAATEKIGKMLMGASSHSSVTQLVVPLQVTAIRM